MSNLTSFVQDGIEIYIDKDTHEAFTSVSAYARMSAIPRSSIQNRVKGCSDTEVKTAKILTPGGLQGVRLISEDLIVQWLPEDNPAMATKLMKLGVRKFLHEIAGYSIKPTPEIETQPQPDPTPQLQSRRIAVETAQSVASIKSLLAESEPRLAQILVDYAMNDVLEGLPTAKTLPEHKQPELRGVAEIAADMGYTITHSNRSSLGKFVKRQLEDLGKQEKRLCNGTMRSVWCYPDSSVVRGVIDEYFS